MPENENTLCSIRAVIDIKAKIAEIDEKKKSASLYNKMITNKDLIELVDRRMLNRVELHKKGDRTNATAAIEYSSI